MSTYPIAATSLSFNDIKQNLIDFVMSKPDANRWRDFYTGGEGTILIELIAGYGFYTAMKIIFSREETYLQYANTLLSARAIALNSSYSAFRGTNRRYYVKFTPTVTQAIPAFTVIGYQGDYDFITLEDVVLNAGEEIIIYGAIGTFNSAAIEAPSADLHVFRFNDDLISNDYKLYLNNIELPTTSISAEALEDKYLVQSNAVGGVNVTYLNLNENFTHKYKTGDELKLVYIQYQNIPYSSEINIDYADSAEIVKTENTIVPETIESIQVKAPIMYETQQIVRSREDYVKNLLLMRAKFSDTTGRDLSAAYVELSYAQYDKMLLTQEETQSVLHNLTYKRMFGIPMPYINKPRFLQLNLNIDLSLTSSSLTLTEYDSIIAKVLSDFEFKFSDEMEEVRVDLAEIERLLEKETHVRRARVSIPKKSFEKSSFYQLGDVLYDPKNPEYFYRVSNISYKTGTQEPAWNYTIGSLTNDGDLVWEAVPLSGHPDKWSAQSNVVLYDLRIPTNPKKAGIMFRSIRGKSRSHASTEPEWSGTIGEYTYDNQLIWLTIEEVATAPKWEPNTWYNLGDIIKAGAFSYQVIGERRLSSNSGPTISAETTEFVYQNLVFVRESIAKEQISLPWGTYCIIVPNVNAEVAR